MPSTATTLTVLTINFACRDVAPLSGCDNCATRFGLIADAISGTNLSAYSGLPDLDSVDVVIAQARLRTLTHVVSSTAAAAAPRAPDPGPSTHSLAAGARNRRGELCRRDRGALRERVRPQHGRFRAYGVGPSVRRRARPALRPRGQAGLCFPDRPRLRRAPSHEITPDRTRSHEIIRRHTRSHEITLDLSANRDHPRSLPRPPEISRDHTRSHKVTRDHTRSHQVRRVHPTSCERRRARDLLAPPPPLRGEAKLVRARPAGARRLHGCAG